MLQQYISYFSDCYKADNREFTITNFFSSKYECQYVIKNKEELVNNEYPIQFIAKKQALSILQTLEMFKNDKELLYGTLFCIGKRKNFQKRVSNIVAPLFYYEATVVEKEEDFYLRINNFNDRKVNVGFLKTLSYKTSFEMFYKELEKVLQKHSFINFEFISAFKNLIAYHVENLEEEILLFPKLKTQTNIKKKLLELKGEEEFQLLSASGVFVSSKANNINGVVNELEALKRSKEYSSGLQQFFSEANETNSGIVRPPKIPVLLNKAQEKVLSNADNFNKSVIIGPPGTGKTYTISAIAQDYISQGKSVLIVTKTAQALNVIEDKLNDFELGKFVVKVGGKYYKRRLISYLNKISSGMFEKQRWINKSSESVFHYNHYFKRLGKLEGEFYEKIEKEKQRIDKKFSEGFFKRKWNELDIKWWRKKENEEWKLIADYFFSLKKFEVAAESYLKYSLAEKIIGYAKSNRIELIKLVNAFTANDKAVKKEGLAELNFDHLTRLLPIWLVKIDEISEGLPFQKELFDIVIVDEATQCDIASALPVFQRAKKVVVAGDTNQLRHISFLSRVQMKSFQRRYKLELDERFNYRTKSLLDFTLEFTPTNDQVVLLDEHYRSLPDIIAFSNAKFYNNSLRIMSKTPKNKNKQSVFIENVGGIQQQNGTNEIEGKLIVKKLHQIIKGESDLTVRQATTIGVLSPFRNQTDYLTKLIKKEIPLESIKKHKIRLGTPYHFQGEERDVMLLSMAIDNDSHSASLNYLNKEDVFNVAITRARHQQLVYLSANKERLKTDSLLSEYINSNFVINDDKPTIGHDDFSKEVCEYLEKLHCNIHLAYDIAGLFLDILVEYDGNYLGIDLIGFPGDFEEAFSIERYKILNRVGIEIFPISYISWKYQREELERRLQSKIYRS